MINKRQIKPIKVHGKVKLAKVKPVNLIQNKSIRKVKNMRITEELTEEMQPINGKKVATAFRTLQRCFMNASIKDTLEGRKNEK